MVKIIPSIPTSDPKELMELLKRCEGICERVSIDIVDGRFAKNKTIEPDILNNFETDLKIDYQLMVVEPINWVEACIRGQADRIIGHIEHMSDQAAFVSKVQEVGVKVGLALDLDTPVSKIDPAIINSLDVVLVMSVPAGFGGQKFDERALQKIKELDEIRSRDSSPFIIHDDGGVTLEKIYNVHRLGVEEVSIGKRIFDGDLKAEMDKYQKAAHNIYG